jgi:hypothetical protein
MMIDVVGEDRRESSARREADREGRLELPPEAVAQSLRGEKSCKKKEGKEQRVMVEGVFIPVVSR